MIHGRAHGVVPRIGEARLRAGELSDLRALALIAHRDADPVVLRLTDRIREQERALVGTGATGGTTTAMRGGRVGAAARYVLCVELVSPPMAVGLSSPVAAASLEVAARQER
jgi:hypothetical protein